jgi:dTDP-glucose pyrophosphorylase
MKNWKNTLVPPSAAIRQVIKTIDDSSAQIAMVVDAAGMLLGTVTDGDIRRGILRGVSLDDPVERVMNTAPSVAHMDQGRDDLLLSMRQRQLHRLPVVDEVGRVVGLEFLEELIQPTRQDNWVVLMAGGLGSRLRPLTDECPKPMLKVGNKPLLETIVESFVDSGFHRFYLSVNYMADMIRDHFGDGSRWGVEIRYLEEDRRLGTAGALSLLPERPSAPIIVMNGDVLTKVNFRQLLDFHGDHKAMATMCVREYDFQVPYGVVRIDGHRVLTIDEKPVQRFFVNAGIYVLAPDALEAIPRGEFFDMPTLFEKLIGQGGEAAVFPVREYWLDIGHLADYERANGEFCTVFA